MKQLRIIVGLAVLLCLCGFGGAPPGGSSGGGGGGTLITSGAGDFGSGTSQTGGVLTGTVVSGAHLTAGSVPNAALATTPLTTAGKGIAVNGATVSASGSPTNILNWQTDVTPTPTCDGKYYFDGSMDNNSTATLTATSSTTSTGSQTLPEATVTVASTAGFVMPGPFTMGGQSVTCTAIATTTTFTGCSGGTGTITGGSTVTQLAPIFAAGDVGKTIEVDGAAASAVPKIFTISTFTDSSHVVLSANNTSGGAISGKMFAYGTDNTASVNALSTAMAAGPSYVNLGQCNAVVTAAAHLVIPPYLNTIIQGAGGGFIGLPPGTVNGNPLATAQPATMFMTLTTSMTGAFIQAVNGAGVGTYDTSSALRDFAVMGAVGFGVVDQVGGSSTSDCAEMINWNGLEFDNVACWNFGRHGFYADVATSGNTANNIDVITFNHTASANNGGAGYRIGGTAAGGNMINFQIQDVDFLNQSVAYNNHLAGYSIVSGVAGLVIRDSFAQGDGNGAGFPNVQGEIEVWNPSAGVIEGNYIEIHGTGALPINGIAIREGVSPAATMINGLQVTGNFIISDVASGTYDYMVVGSDASHTAGGVTISSNWTGHFNGTAVNACFELHPDSAPMSYLNNWCDKTSAYQ
jgi:hypothetical protein